MGWFSEHQNPAKLVQKTIAAIAAYGNPQNTKKSEALETIEKCFSVITLILYQKSEGDESSTRAIHLVTEISHSNLLLDGLNQFINFPVELRKQFTITFTGSLAMQINSQYPVESWILSNPIVFDILLGFYEHPELAISAGQMLRVCSQHPPLASALLTFQLLDRLFPFFMVSHFDVSSDLLSLLKA